MRAAMIEAPNRPTVTTVDDPTPGPGDVVVAVDSCGICGTDLHILGGEFAPAYPIVPGHEFAGRVVAVGSDVDDLDVDSAVAVDPSLHCLACSQCRRGRGNLCEQWAAIGVSAPGGFAEYVSVPRRNVYAMPADVPLRFGGLVEPLSCAVHGLDRLPREPGDTVLIYGGGGTMGLMLGQLLRSNEIARIDVVDRNADRLPLAERLCADRGATSADELDTDRWDIVIDATGAIPAIEDGLPRVRPGGTFFVFGVAPEQATVPYSPFEIYKHEISIIGSMAVLHSFGRALDLIAAGAIDCEALLTDRMGLDEFAAALERVRTGQGLKTTVAPNGS